MEGDNWNVGVNNEADDTNEDEMKHWYVGVYFEGKVNNYIKLKKSAHSIIITNFSWLFEFYFHATEMEHMTA